VVLPSQAELGDTITLIDRFPAAVITLVDVASGSVGAQLDVSTGFRANPHDVAWIGGARWVARYDMNPVPGKQPFDVGGDLLLIDGASRQIVARRELSQAVQPSQKHLPHPDRIALWGERMFVSLAAYDAKYVDEAPSRVVVIDTVKREIVATHVLEGMYGCGAMALEPPFDGNGMPRAKRRLLVGCAGRFGGTGTPTLKESGLVLLDVDAAPKEIRRFTAEQIGGQPVGFDIDIDEGGRALVTTMGRKGSTSSDTVTDALREVDLDGGGSREVLRTASEPFVLGGVRCITRARADVPNPGSGAPCTSDCFVADAERGVLHRLVRDAVGYRAAEQLKVETAIGLPPRALGRF
jgi:hypothetical protein